jgi:hypothetical protein
MAFSPVWFLIYFHFVMAGLDPAIHVFPSIKKNVDARHEAGHDG